MPTYTTRVEDRDPDKLKLTKEEAVEMATAGFQFAEYDLEQHRFRLSIPYRTAQNLDRGTLTFVQ